MSLPLTRLNALTSSILEAFETLGLGVEEIASANDLDVVVVKSVLLQFSSRYKQECLEEEDKEPLVSKDEVKGYIRAYKGLVDTDDDYLRERALRNLINLGMKVTDGLGESNPRKLLEELGSSGNIMALNDILQKAKKAKLAAQQNLGKIIDIGDSVPA